MATTIVTKYGSDAPAASDIVRGELAVDTENGRLYTENSSAAVIELGSNPSGNITFGDGGKAIFGAGSDLQIYHDASHSYVVDAGTGNMYISTNGNGIVMQASLSETMLAALPNGAVTLYYDNAAKLATTSTGIQVTGNIANASGDMTVDSAGGLILDAATGVISLHEAGNGVFGTLTRASGSLAIKSEVSDADIIFKGNDGGSEITALTLDMSDGGTASFNSHIRLGDNKTASFGAGFDIEITSDGTNGTIGAPNGNLTLDVAGEIILDADGTGTIRFNDGGTNFGMVFGDNSDFSLISKVQDKDMIFKGNDGGSTITALTLDFSEAGAATFNSTVTSTGLTVDGGAISTGDFTGTAAGSVRISGNGTTLGTTSFDLIQNSSGAYVYHRANLPLIFGTNNTERLRIGSTGIIYVNGDGTGGRLSGDGSGGLVLQDGNGRQSFKIMSPSSGSVQAMTLDANSNLLVGKTATAYGTAGIEARSGGTLWATASGTNAASFNRLSSEGTIAYFSNDGTEVGTIGSNAGFITLGKGDTGLLFHDGQDAIWPRNLSTGASRDGSIDLGGASDRFKDLWLSGTAKVGNDVILGNQETTGTGGTARIVATGGQVYFQGGLAATSGSAAPIVFGAYGGTGERARLTADGDFLVGTNDVTPGQNDTNVGTSISSAGRLMINNAGADNIMGRNTDGVLLSIRKAGEEKGSITVSSTATTYNTSSDYRLKENIADADDAGSKVDAIQVRKFDWKADGAHQDYGMIAQELIEVAPEAVSAPEDPEEMMGVDYSKLVPMLVKEIQQLRQRVAQLEE